MMACVCHVTTGNRFSMRQQRPPGCSLLFWATAIRSVQTSLFCQPGLLPSSKVQDEDHSPALWRRGHCCGSRGRGTRSKMFRHVISQLAKFPTFKTLTFPIALNAEAIGVAFQRGQNCSRCQQKAHRTKSGFPFFFPRVCSHPGAVCQSHSEYTLHRLEHLEVRSSLIII